MLSTKEQQQLKNIGYRLRQERLKQNLTQAQIAFELNTSTKQYQRIEYGEISTSVLTILKLADILDVKVSVLLEKV